MNYGTVDREDCVCCEPKNGPRVVEINVKTDEL